MTRCTRLALALALVAPLVFPPSAAAAPPDRSAGDLVATAESWLARLWAPLSHLFGRSDASGGPTIDPDGATAPAPTSHHAESDGGPTIDPNGIAAPPPTNNADGDYGPTIDPNGIAAPPPTNNSEGDYGPTIDPDG